MNDNGDIVVYSYSLVMTPVLCWCKMLIVVWFDEVSMIIK
jgi:hypothetical protein